MGIRGPIDDGLRRDPSLGWKKRVERVIELADTLGAQYLKNEPLVDPSSNVLQAYEGQLYWSGSVIGGGGGGTLSVAANDASDESKARADYVCDGVDDDIDINAALAALPGVGGKISLSEGTFNISNPIDIPNDDITLEGMGNSTYIDGAGLATTEHAIVVDGMGYCILKNFMISTGSGGGRTSHCIYVAGTLIGLVIDRVFFYNSDDDGIYIYTDGGVYRSYITNCLFRDIDGSGIYVGGNAAGGVSGLTIHNNTITQGAGGGVVFDTGSSGHTYCSINDNYIVDSGVEGIILYDMVDSTINNNIIIQPGDDGIIVEDCDYCTFNSNVIAFNLAGSGIKLTANCNHIVIVGNQLSGYVQYGVEIAAITVVDTIVTGNSIEFSGVDYILDSGLRTKHRVQHRDSFIDCLPTTGNHIVNAQALVNGAVAVNLSPDVPRYISFTITEGAPGDVNDYTLTIVGVNAQGEAVTFTTDFATSGLVRFIDENFLYITSVTLADVADLGAATISIGIEDRLGLSNRIIVGSVYAVKRNTAYDVPANWTEFVIGNGVNVDNVAAIVGGDDFMIYYWESLNKLG